MKKNTNQKKLKILRFVSLLVGFQMSMIAYVRSSYLQDSSGLENVGILFLLGYGASFLVLLNMHHLVKRYGKSKVLLSMLMFKTLSLVGMGFLSVSFLGAIFGIWSLMAGALVMVGMDIVIENFSRDKTTGATRGANLSMFNLGILLAPFLAVSLLSNWGYRPIFFLSALASIVAFVIILAKFPHVNHNIKKDLRLKEVLVKIWKRRDLARIFYVSFLMELFYAVMVVYSPLYLLNQGLDWIAIGKIFTVMLIPFVIIQYPLGVLCDKKTGEKEFLMVAIIIMGFSTAAVSFISGSQLVYWMIILFLTRIGVSMVEVLRDSYFYKQISSEDVDIIDFYRTARDLGYIVGMGFFSLYLIFFSLQSVFFVLGLIILTGLVPLWKLKDTE